MKYLIIVGDGMADERMPQLGGKSPLEVADIPTINRLARQGVVGHAQNCPPGFSVGSDIAHLSILGCDPSKHFHGRGPMEAAALGFAVEPTDAVFRCNLLTMEDGDGPLDEKGFVSFNAGCIEGEDALEVVRTLKADPDFAAALKKYDMELRETPTFRQILIHHHGDFEGLYFETNWEGVKGPCKQVFPRGNEAKAEPYLTLMRLANKALEHAPINERRRKEGKLPANGIWLWAEGKAAKLPSLQERYGKSGAVVAAVPVVKGLGAMLRARTVRSTPTSRARSKPRGRWSTPTISCSCIWKRRTSARTRAISRIRSRPSNGSTAASSRRCSGRWTRRRWNIAFSSSATTEHSCARSSTRARRSRLFCMTAAWIRSAV